MFFFRRLFNPEIFQGVHKKASYFEGWYYKIIDSQIRNAFAVIPGVSFGKEISDRHAFIQILNAADCSVNYIQYDIKDFRASNHDFKIEIGRNFFSEKELRLDIATESVSLAGRLLFSDIIPYPKTFLSPGIMGPFSFIPFMECHHGIVNVHHKITGELVWCGNSIDFSNGCGYIEKDWGTSFPKAWIWLQSNHFEPGNVTFQFSMARIPWLGKAFTGMISFLRIDKKFYVFATYTGAKVTQLSHTGDKLAICVEDGKYRIEITAERSGGGVLKAPRNGLMNDEITESISAEIYLKLSEKNGMVLFEGKGTNAGLEIKNEAVFLNAIQ